MELVLDFLIYFFLGTLAVYLVHGVHDWKETSKNTWRMVMFFSLVFFWVTVFYGSFIEPRIITIQTEHLQINPSPTQKIRAVIFSDLHLGPFKKQEWAQRVVQEVQALHPDIVFILGDFIVTTSDEIAYLKPLENLSAPYGVYGVTGNHDYYANAIDTVIARLDMAGIEMIENEVLDLEIGGKILRLAGVSDIWFEGDVEKTLKDVTDDQSVILLAHNPDVVISPWAKRADVVFAGHTHAGQVRLPWIGPIGSIPTKLGQAYDRGWFLYEGLKLFITSGVSESGTRARLFNPPEIINMEIYF